jgi:hypothetical protein
MSRPIFGTLFEIDGTSLKGSSLPRSSQVFVSASAVVQIYYSDSPTEPIHKIQCGTFYKDIRGTTSIHILVKGQREPCLKIFIETSPHDLLSSMWGNQFEILRRTTPASGLRSVSAILSSLLPHFEKKFQDYSQLRKWRSVL